MTNKSMITKRKGKRGYGKLHEDQGNWIGLKNSQDCNRQRWDWWAFQLQGHPEPRSGNAQGKSWDEGAVQVDRCVMCRTRNRLEGEELGLAAELQAWRSGVDWTSRHEKKHGRGWGSESAWSHQQHFKELDPKVAQDPMCVIIKFSWPLWIQDTSWCVVCTCRYSLLENKIFWNNHWSFSKAMVKQY